MQAVDGGRAVDRLAFFSDAVFAVVLALLGIHIAIAPSYVTSGALHDALGDAAPELIGFGFSFAMIAVLWIDHHRLFDHLRGRDERLLWANAAFLLCVAFLTYPAGVFTKHTGAPVAALFFAGSLMVTALVLAALWWYASGTPRLAGNLDRAVRLELVRRPLTTVAVLLVSMPFVVVGFHVGEFELTLASIVWIAGLAFARISLLRREADPTHAQAAGNLGETER
jgi:TMEM175 potassium channel family protein